MRSIVFVVDDDRQAQDALARKLQHLDVDIELIDSAHELLERCDPTRPGCLVLKAELADANALDLPEKLAQRGVRLPFLVLSAREDVSLAVEAMRRGAVDFLVEPCDADRLIAGVRQAVKLDAGAWSDRAGAAAIHARVGRLTPREREVTTWVARGLLTKQIAGRLGISIKTVEVHRSHIMKKLDVHSLAQLALLLHAHETARAEGIARPR